MQRERELALAFLSRRLTRRELVRAAAATGASLPVIAALVACGGAAATPTRGPAAGGAATAAGATATTGQATGPPKSGGTLVMSYPQAVADTLNQHLSNFTVSRMVARHVLDNLVAVDPATGDIKPWLATSWDVSSDGLQYTFRLKQGVKFHDGTPFNAQAVKANFDLTMDPQTKHAAAYQALGGDKYDHTEVVDDTTAKVVFKRPHVSFLPYLSDGATGIDSPDALKKYGADYGIKALVGSGPFKFVEWVKNDHVNLERNPDYQWGPPIAKHQGPAYLDKLVFRDIKEDATRGNALQNGDVQMAQLVETLVAQFKGSNDVRLLTVPKAGTTRMYLMNAAKPPTDDIKVRQAVIMSVDKAALIQLPAWAGIGKPGIAPLPSNMVPHGDLSSLKQYDLPYDPEKAKQLLDQAGWTPGSGGIRTKNGQQLALDMVTTADSLPQVQPLDGMLNKVGGKLNIRSGDFNFWIDTVTKKDFGITLMSDSGSDPAGMIEEFFYSKAPYASYGISTPELDTTIEAAVNATNRDTMWQNLFKAMAMILQTDVGVMAWEQLYIFGARATVQDPAFNEVGFPYLYDAWLK